MGSTLVMLSFLGWFLWSQQRGIIRRYQRAGGFEIHSLIQYYSICLYSMIPLGEYAVTFGSKKKKHRNRFLPFQEEDHGPRNLPCRLRSSC